MKSLWWVSRQQGGGRSLDRLVFPREAEPERIVDPNAVLTAHRGRMDAALKHGQRKAMDWTEAAERKLKEVPFFVRPAVRRRIEGLAAEAGLSSIDPGFYEEARARFARN
jgi:hypothetical protein